MPREQRRFLAIIRQKKYEQISFYFMPSSLKLNGLNFTSFILTVKFMEDRKHFIIIFLLIRTSPKFHSEPINKNINYSNSKINSKI